MSKKSPATTTVQPSTKKTSSAKPAKNAHGQLWRAWEDKFLQDHFPTKGAEYCTKRLGRTITAIESRAQKLKIRHNEYYFIQKARKKREWPEDIPMPPASAFNGNQLWTREDEELLRKWYPKYGTRYCSRLLGRSVDSIKIRANRLGFTKEQRWTQQELEYIKAQYGKLTIEQIAADIGRTVIAVKQQAGQLKVTSPSAKWTKKDLSFLQKHFSTKGAAYVAQSLGRTVGAVHSKASIIGVSAPPAKRLSKREQSFIMENVGKISFISIAKKLQRSIVTVTKYAQKNGYDAGRKRVTDWRPEEDRFLRENYRTMLVKDIAAQLGRSAGGTLLRVRVLKLDSSKGKYRSQRTWSKKEIALLRKLYSTHTYTQIAAELGRTALSVKHKALELELPTTTAIKQWSKKEEELLRQLYPTQSVQKIGVALGRNRADVRQRAEQLQIAKKTQLDAPWTKRDQAKLRKLYGTMTSAELGKVLGRSSISVLHQAHRMGLRYPEEKMGKPWSEEEDTHLRKLFELKTNHAQIAAAMNRSMSSVKGRLKVLGLKFQERRKSLPPEQEATIRQLFGTMSAEKIAKQVGLKASLVRFYAKKFGLTYPEDKQHHFWTPEEDEQLRTLFPTMNAPEIAKTMGFPVLSVKGRLRWLKLKRFDRWWSTEPKANNDNKRKKSNKGGATSR